MNLFDFFRRGSKPTTADAQMSANATVANLTLDSEQLRQALAGINTGGNIAVNAHTVTGIPTAWRSVTILSHVMAGLPLNVIQTDDTDDTRKKIKDNPVYRMMNLKPNNWQDPFQYRRLAQVHLSLRGNHYAKRVKPLRSGDSEMLLPINPDVIEPKLVGNEIIYEFSRTNGTKKIFKADEIFHLRGMSFDGVKGLSPLQVARETFELSLKGSRTASNVLDNSSIAGYGLKHPAKLSAEAHKNLTESFEQKIGGFENAGKPPIFEEGLEVVPLGFSALDSQFLESRRLSVTDIARIFGMPPHMIFDTERSTSWGTGIEQQTIGFVVYTLQEWIRTWECALRFQFLQDDPDLSVKLSTQALNRGDSKTRWGIYDIARRNEDMSSNEIRALEDLPPREDGDEYKNPAINPADDGEPNDED